MEISKYNIKKISMLIFGAILFNWGLGNLHFVVSFIRTIWGYILPFALGAALAFLLNIPMRAIERHILTFISRIQKKKNKPITLKKVRPLSIILTLLIVVGVIWGLIIVIIPQIGQAVLSLKSSVPYFIEFFDKANDFVGEKIPLLEKQIESMNIDLSKVAATVSNMLQKFGEGILNSSLSVASTIFSGIINSFIAFIFSIYILSSKEVLTRQCISVIRAFVKPFHSKKLFYLLRLIDSTFTKFFTGQCLEAVILGLMFFAGMAIFGFPYAAMISALVSVTALIPVFGAFIACIVGAFLILVENPMQALWFIVFFLVMQQIEGNLIYPRVMGNSIGLPAIWVLVAVTVGASMMGIAGMLLFIPLFSVFYSLLRGAVRAKNTVKKENVTIKKEEI